MGDVSKRSPRKLGVTHWSSRLLAEQLGIDHSTVAKAWREDGVVPLREGTFKFSTDPDLIATVVDVVGLYLAPPANAIVLCVDEKSQINLWSAQHRDFRSAREAGSRLGPTPSRSCTW